jgi:hypothetical protein
VGALCRLTRLVLGLSEQQAAEDFGVTLRTYRKWEAGKIRRLLWWTLSMFMEKHDVSYDWLFDGDTARVGKHLQKGTIAILQVDRRKRHEVLWYRGKTFAERSGLCRRAVASRHYFGGLFLNQIS